MFLKEVRDDIVYDEGLPFVVYNVRLPFRFRPSIINGQGFQASRLGCNSLDPPEYILVKIVTFESKVPEPGRTLEIAQLNVLE